MRIILAIFCGIVVLFAGGCALILVSGAGYNGMFQTIPGAVIPGGIAALNVLVLVALFGSAKPQTWAFYTLAVIDAIVVAGLALTWSSLGIRDSEINVMAAVLIGGFALKGLLTVLVARRA